MTSLFPDATSHSILLAEALRDIVLLMLKKQGVMMLGPHGELTSLASRTWAWPLPESQKWPERSVLQPRGKLTGSFSS